MSTPYSYTTLLILSGKEGAADYRGLVFNPDGSQCYLYEDSVKQINTYQLSTPWLVSSAIITGSSLTVPTYGNSFAISYDGRYVFFSSASTIYQYTLGTPWVLSTASLTRTKAFSHSVYGIAFSSTGGYLYVTTYTDLYQYSLTSWNVSTVTLVGSVAYSLGTIYTPNGLHMSPYDWRLYISGYNLGNRLVRIDFAEKYNIAGATQTNESLTGSYASISGTGVFFPPTEPSMYIVNAYHEVYQFVSTAYEPPQGIFWCNFHGQTEILT